jgi:23S rRNA pseudouridine2605 synthase
VRVNGRVITELGAKADLRNDRIEVDGKQLMYEAPIYLVLHKPRGVVSTMSDPEGRPTVAELVRRAPARVYPVGRLDYATSGVLLMTSDGDFANGLLHPRGGVPKTYVIKVSGNMEEADLDRWRQGVTLEDGERTLPAEVKLLRHEGDKTWIEVVLREGKNQQIRRMGEATGFRVMRLARTSFAGVDAEGLRPGDWRPLTIDELTDIRKAFGVPKRLRAARDMHAPTSRGRPEARSRPRPAGRQERATEATPKRGAAPQVTPGRSDRSGTKPRAAGTREPRARGRAGR